MNVPASVSIKTASYTIPTGKYAEVVPFFEDRGVLVSTSLTPTVTLPTCTINGVRVKSSFFGVFINGTTVSRFVSYTLPFPNIMRRGTSQNGTNFIGVNEDILQTYTLSSLANQSAFAHFKPEDNVGNNTIIVPEGTVLSGTGTGFRWVVTEYTV